MDVDDFQALFQRFEFIKFAKSDILRRRRQMPDASYEPPRAGGRLHPLDLRAVMRASPDCRVVMGTGRVPRSYLV